MKKLTYTTAIFMAMVATSVFAHHPSEEMSPSYDMVDDQLEAVESPHLDMTFDDMGSTTAAGDSDMSTATQDQEGWAAVDGDGQTQDGTITLEQPQDGPGPAADAGTIDLMESVAQ